MRSAIVIVALASLLPLPSFAQDHPPFGRQLHYAGTKTIDGQPSQIAIDLDIGRADSDAATWIVVDEHVGARDLGVRHVTLDRSGVVENDAGLSAEEVTVLDMVALQFEDVDGVDPGDHWNRKGTQFVVRHTDGITIDFEIACAPTWHGVMRYNAKTAAPTSIQVDGDLQFSASLVADSFGSQASAQ